MSANLPHQYQMAEVHLTALAVNTVDGSINNRAN
jgi:hypothetical protein